MSQLNLNASVGDWVAQFPRTSRVFESLKIDYCCGGGKSLEEACWDRELDPEQVYQQIEATLAESGEPTKDWLHAPLGELCDHIEATHHDYLKRELPRLAALVSKVASVHGEAHPELGRLRNVFVELRAELEPHMFKEDRVLFPAIRLLEESQENPAFPFGTVANPIRRMEIEHDHAGDGLAELRRLTRDFQPPEGACNTYLAMLDGLAELEANMHQHVHKENNILFPRAIDLEDTRLFPKEPSVN